MKKIILSFMSLFAFIGFGFTESYIYFYGNGCAHCAQVEQYFDENDMYSKYNIVSKEIYFNNDNREEFLNYGQQLQIPSSSMGVPFLLVDDNGKYDYILGDKPIIDFFEKKNSNDIVLASIEKVEIDKDLGNTDIKHIETQKSEFIEQPIEQENKEVSYSDLENNMIEEELMMSTIQDSGSESYEGNKKTTKERLGFFGIMLPAAIADSINPCEFAIIVLLLGSLLVRTKNRRKVILTGLSFSFAIFLSYFLMGIGLRRAFSSATNVNLIKIIAGSLGILVGLANLKDVFWHGKLFVMEVPFSRRPRLQKFVKSITSPIGAFFIGLVVSLFLLPCTSGPYITILTFMSASQVDKLRGMLYLFVYNIFFIVPMILITFLVSFGQSRVEKLNKLKDKYNWLTHLIVGLLMLGLGAYVFITL
ncbi:MAG: cytochrome c biogenesis CcdA family protein [Candidatus Absconditabacteria bacterium]|nr:cytochrome c biogenesis CcdA family protein [Candidatus Absconditabacteria bacterium]